MKLFCRLYRKELNGSRHIFLTLLGLIMGIDVFLITRISSWGYWRALQVTFLPHAFLVFWALFRAFAIPREEWKEGTAPFLRSLPISGWGIVGAKLLAVFTEWFTLSLATVTFSGLFYAAAPLWGENWLGLTDLLFSGRAVRFMVFSGINLSLGIMLGGIIFQLAYLLGRTVNRFHGLVSVASTVLLIYITTKGSEFLSQLFSDFLGITLESRVFSPNEDLVLSYSLVSMVVLLIEFALLFFITGWVMEKKAES